MKARMINYGSIISDIEVTTVHWVKKRSGNPWWKFWRLHDYEKKENTIRYFKFKHEDGFINENTGEHLLGKSLLYNLLNNAYRLGLVKRAKEIEDKYKVHLTPSHPYLSLE